MSFARAVTERVKLAIGAITAVETSRKQQQRRAERMSDAPLGFKMSQAVGQKRSTGQRSRSKKATRPKNRCELSGSDGSGALKDCPSLAKGISAHPCDVLGRRRLQTATDVNRTQRGVAHVN